MNPERKPNPALIAIIVIALLAIAGGAAYAATRPDAKDTQSTTSETTADTPSSSNVATDASSRKYKDGTYEATGSYSTPGGRESIDLTVTLADNVITDTKISGSGTTRDSREHQTEFANGYKSLVVGKNIDEVSLSRVAGSSLTSNGFNDALEQIKTDAKA